MQCCRLFDKQSKGRCHTNVKSAVFFKKLFYTLTSEYLDPIKNYLHDIVCNPDSEESKEIIILLLLKSDKKIITWLADNKEVLENMCQCVRGKTTTKKTPTPPNPQRFFKPNENDDPGYGSMTDIRPQNGTYREKERLEKMVLKVSFV